MTWAKASVPSERAAPCTGGSAKRLATDLVLDVCQAALAALAWPWSMQFAERVTRYYMMCRSLIRSSYQSWRWQHSKRLPDSSHLPQNTRDLLL